MHDYYEILQVSPKAEPEVIQAAYKRLALKYHPDRNRDPQALEQMKLLNEAVAVLADPQRRQEYDCVRAAGPEMRQKFVADAIAFGDDALARQDFLSAIRSYSQALDYEPGLAKAYHNRGIAHAGTGNFGQAVADISEAIRLTPLDPIAYRNRARAYQALGEIDHAKADLEQANRLMPGESQSAPAPEEDAAELAAVLSGNSLVALSIAITMVTFVTAVLIDAVPQHLFDGALRAFFAPWPGMVFGGLLGGLVAILAEGLGYWFPGAVSERLVIAGTGTTTAIVVACAVGIAGVGVAATVGALAVGITASHLLCGTALARRFAVEVKAPAPPAAGGSAVTSWLEYPLVAWCRVGTVAGIVPGAALAAYTPGFRNESVANVGTMLGRGAFGAALGATLGLWVALFSWILARRIHRRVVGVDRRAGHVALRGLTVGACCGALLSLLLVVRVYMVRKANAGVDPLIVIIWFVTLVTVGIGYWAGYLGGIALWGYRMIAGKGYAAAVVSTRPGQQGNKLLLQLLFTLPLWCLSPIACIADRWLTVGEPTTGSATNAVSREVRSAPELGIVVNDRLEVTAVLAMVGRGNKDFELSDRILAIANIPVRSETELQDAVNRFRPGETLRVRVLRNGAAQEFDTVLGARTVP